MKICIVIVIVFMPLAAWSADWTTQDTILQASLIGLIAIDWMQTLESLNGNYYETNPILGKEPSRSEVNICIASSMIIATAVAYLLPSKYRIIFQSIVIGVELEAVNYNYQIGIRF